MLGKAGNELLTEAVGTCTTEDVGAVGVVPPHDPNIQSIMFIIMDIMLVQACGWLGGVVAIVTFTICGCD